MDFQQLIFSLLNIFIELKKFRSIWLEKLLFKEKGKCKAKKVGKCKANCMHFLKLKIQKKKSRIKNDIGE